MGPGSRVPPLAVAALGGNLQTAREELPPYRAWFDRGQLRWTAIGISSYFFAGTAFFLISVLLPKALVDQGGAVTLSFGVTSLVFAASIPGKGFTGYLMEIIGRRWTILCPRRLAARRFPDDDGAPSRILRHAGDGDRRADDRIHRTVGRDCLPDLPLRAIPDGTARARSCLWRVDGANLFRSTGALPNGAVHRLAAIFFGTILVVVTIGAFIPLLFGRETVGQLETVTEAVPALA